MKKEITILHSNDIHGQLNFTADEDLTIRGGISLLSGYVKKTREEREVFLGICGDVLQEDIHGSDYKGANTVELINYLKPDAVSLGNHELDYGLAHLLVFQNCLASPLLCANIYVANLNRMLFTPSRIFEVGGVRMLMIGVIPRQFFNRVLTDEFCRSTLAYKETYDAVREELRSHAGTRIDLVVLMSHYGIEGDRTLAENLPDDIHVDLILGGHSHIVMERAEVINGIPIAQSGYGTDDIGRFDLTVDTEKGGLADWKWELIRLTDKTACFDTGVDDLADRVVFENGARYDDSEVCEFADAYEQKSRLFESDLGNIVADAFASIYPVDFVILQSGSLRLEVSSRIMKEKDFRALYPFDDKFYVIEISGSEIREAFDYLFSLKEDGSIMGGTFQYSRGFRIEVDAADCWEKGCRVKTISFKGEELEDDHFYRLGVTKNCSEGFVKYFNVTPDPERLQLVSTSTFNDLVGYFLRQKSKVTAPEKGRFILRNFKWES